MKSVAVVEPDRIELVDIPQPEVGPYDALVKTEISYLCNATDRKVIEGHFPGIEHYPSLLGHESVGIVQQTGERVMSFTPGDRVVGGMLLNPPVAEYGAAWGGFSEYILATDHEAMVRDGVADAEHGWVDIFKIQKKVSEKISAEAAGLLCTWREVYAGFQDFHLTPEDEILIFGAGPVGLSFVKFAKLMGFRYVGSVDPLPAKREKALEMGADEVFSPRDAALENFAEHHGYPLDAVIDAVGNEAVINGALSMVKMAGSICVYGVLGEATITLEKSRGPYNFNLLVHQWPTRDAEAAAHEPLCAWIEQGKLVSEEFVSNRFPIESFGEAYDLTRTGNTIKTLFTWT